MTGVSKILSPDIQLSHGAINFFFDSDGDLDPAGSNQDVTVSATLQNLSGTPTFSIVEADGSSQLDVTFTTGATSLSASSATVDASSASSSTSYGNSYVGSKHSVRSPKNIEIRPPFVKKLKKTTKKNMA